MRLPALRFVLGLVVSVSGAGVLAAPVGAQDADEPRWTSAAYYQAVQVRPSPEREFWHTGTVLVMRTLSGGSVGGRGLVARRFDRTEAAIGADVYHDLWDGAYGNLSLMYAPEAEVLPERQATVQLFQAIGRIEVSGSYRHQAYPATDVNTPGLGLGGYFGRWYLRQHSLVAYIGDDQAAFFSLMARRYIDEAADSYINLSAGLGEEVLEAAPVAGAGGVNVITSDARFAGVQLRRFVLPGLGLLAGGAYSAYDRIPDRWSFTVGVIARW